MPATPDRPLRVAVFSMGDADWVAGTHYLKNLLLALESLSSPDSIDITLVVPPSAGAQLSSNLGWWTAPVLPLPQRVFWGRVIMKLQGDLGIGLGVRPLRFASFLHAARIDAVFCQGEFGPRFDVPLLSWIPDFQHLHLQHMFSRGEIRRRTRRFSRVAQHAGRVVLSSRDALADFQGFAPQAVHKVRVLPFVAQVPLAVYDVDPAWVCERYNLPARFVYLPNQFWRHKNHQLVIRALGIAKAVDPTLTVVCTGSATDWRDPRYFGQLQAEIAALDLSANLVRLGLIPHADVFHLARQSLAVLQPSLFEGWSTTVEEAKSLGKRVIVSDIPVHREQNPPGAVFFDPHDAEALARCLVTTAGEGAAGPDQALEAAARDALPARTRAFAQAFVRTVRECSGSLAGVQG